MLRSVPANVLKKLCRRCALAGGRHPAVARV